jgi:dUTP pyrophosphatase
MKVKIKKLHKDAVLPKQATELAAGHDVIATEIIQEADDFVVCKLGFALTPPPGYKVVLVPRSSLTKTKWILQNSPGQGDEDFTGEYQYRFRAIPDSVEQTGGDYGSSVYWELKYPLFPYNVGDRIGQIFLEEVIKFKFEEVSELSNTERGSNGWGSTGN